MRTFKSGGYAASAWLLVRIGVATVVLIVIAALAGTYTPTYQDCANNPQKYEIGHPNKKTKNPIAFRVALLCEGSALDANSATLTAIFTIVLAASTIGLWGATIRSVRGAERASERELRAYIWVKGTRIRDMETGARPCVDIEMRNAGATPARQVVVRAGSIVCPYPLPPNTPFPKVGVFPTRTKMVLPPSVEPPFGASAPWNGVHPLNDAQRDALRLGRDMRLFAFISVEYVDVFDEPRKTTACFSVQMIPRPNGYDVNFDWADQHNEMT